MGCANELQPAWVREGDDQVEALSVDIFVKSMKIRCCVAYGCQETDLKERKDAFWNYLDIDVVEADNSESGFVLHFDGNLWAGEEIVPGDPRPQNRNGKLFQNFLERHPHLTVVNALPECEGLITRTRVCNGVIQKSVLDFFVVCHRVLPFIRRMVIDEHKEEAEENRKVIIENFQQLSENPENIKMQEMWKLMKRIWPIEAPTKPTAKRNKRGKIVSSSNEIKQVLAKEYKDRLRSRPARPDLVAMKKRKRIIFKMKIKLAESRKSKPWTMIELENALSNLKNNKSRDFEGLINEIFKINVIGVDLKNSLLIMFNKLKCKKMIPNFMRFANITTVPKKGSRIEPKNERGIFRISVLRYILMRMIYNMKYPAIDALMSDCQMGARKKKGCKNNIFIINGIIHDVLKSKKNNPVLLQIYDYQQMFDSIDLEEALSDIYDTGVDDDTLALLYQANKEIHMAVKTPGGLTNRQVLRNIVLQGDTWGSILASVQVDKIGKECMAEGHAYLYENCLPVGFLDLVDDIIGVTEAGLKAQKMNAFINLKTAEKTLQFGPSKCNSMLIGKNTEYVVNSPIIVDNWTVEYMENRETGEVDLKEHYAGLVEVEKTDEQKYLGFVVSCQGNNMANIRQIEKKSIGVVRKVINKLNSLNLGKYYFECSIILMNVILRGSILYACEMY